MPFPFSAVAWLRAQSRPAAPRQLMCLFVVILVPLFRGWGPRLLSPPFRSHCPATLLGSLGDARRACPPASFLVFSFASLQTKISHASVTV
ncbi:uncharacterized protein P884DRAFT_260741 [Thermothelomyces heterothallicus CBS 202.75]|uniref:uncharacterized protein n=1 Tax=Thermothelomyces heterothallicus CBS 202.75 TaxID=1149848 RepID=UPI003743C882